MIISVYSYKYPKTNEKCVLQKESMVHNFSKKKKENVCSLSLESLSWASYKPFAYHHDMSFNNIKAMKWMK